MASGYTRKDVNAPNDYGGKSTPKNKGSGFVNWGFAEGGSTDVDKLRRRLDIKTQGMSSSVREGVADKAQADELRKAIAKGK